MAASGNLGAVIIDVSVPLPGFSGLRPTTLKDNRTILCFSPVAGIQWVETTDNLVRETLNTTVSVPLPGFSGLRQYPGTGFNVMDHRFSPVAGIQWVETNDRLRLMEYRDQEVSVPLPGFSGLRLKMGRV